MMKKKAIYWPEMGLFVLLLVLGILNHKQYGISWDEPIQLEMSTKVYDYVTGKNDAFLYMQNKYHNSTVEFFFDVPHRLLGLDSTDEIYYSRHLVNYLFFWGSAIFLYLLGLEIFRNRKWSVLAVLMLYFTPRFFAHAFYNSKDIPLLFFFVLCIYLGIRLIRRPSYLLALLLAFFTGMAWGARILAILLPFMISAFFLLNIFTRNREWKDLKYLLVFWLAYPVFLYATVPVIWKDPLLHFTHAFTMHSHFPYEDPVLFMGTFMVPGTQPWYYIPVWMGITIPVLFSLYFIFSIGALTFIYFFHYYTFLKRKWIYTLLLVWMVVPFSMVLVLHSVVYDEWRHFFFVYPAYILFALGGCYEFSRWIRKQWKERAYFLFKYSFIAVFALQCVWLGYWMVKNNPHQYVYFNMLAGKNIHLKYDMDYWGLSYKQAWEGYFKKVEGLHDVEWQNNPGRFNLLLFKQEEIDKKIRHVDYMSCEYFLTNYRWYPVYDNYKEELYSVEVDGMKICTIFINPAYQAEK